MDYQHLERIGVEEAGVPPKLIIDFINECEKHYVELHNLVIAKASKIIFEGHAYPYAENIPHYVHSMTKAFTNTAAGIAYTLGLLRLDDKVLSFFPEYAPEHPTEYQKQMTVKDLITMRSGMDADINGSELRTLKSSWIKRYFEQPVPYEPGTHYFYCSGNTYMTSAIVQKVAGMTAQDMIHKYIVSELGMRPFTWAKSPEGICCGNSGISICAEDAVKFGLMYLNHGRYQGKQIISQEWADRSLGLIDPAPVEENKPRYNYHWFQSVIPEMYAAEGFLGQFCALIPKLDMVVVITSATPTRQKMEADELLCKCLVNPLLEGEAVDAVPESTLKLKGSHMNLSPHMPVMERNSALGDEISFYEAEENEDHIQRFIVKCLDTEIVLGIEDDRGLNWITSGFRTWKEGLTGITGNYLHHEMQSEHEHVFACAWWETPTCLKMEWRFVETAFCDYVELNFDGEYLTFTRRVNVNSKALVRPIIRAKLQKTSKR